jgi:2-polyprenyl-3-methyl-5-hydroxy-6-metoxy-1,4-benzoquinol methylase
MWSEIVVTSPLTGTGKIKLIKQFNCSDLIDEWKAAFQIDITDELKGSQQVHLFECESTGLRFFSPDLSGSSRLYEQLQNFDWFYMPDKWEHQVALQNLKRGEKVLEVGCAFGAFIERSLKLGIEASGIEFNEAAVQAAVEKHLPVQRLDLQKLASLNPEVFDAVCSFQVLEHVPNPKEFIDWSIQVLKPGGKLIFCVPNSESFLKYQYNLLDMPPHHMLQWSEGAFKSLENLFPLKLEKVIREPLSAYHVSAYIHAYSKHFKTITQLSRIVFNRVTIPRYEQLLQLGLRKQLTGQSLYVQFKKIL